MKKWPSAYEMESALRWSLTIVTPIALFLVAMSIAFRICDGWLVEFVGRLGRADFDVGSLLFGRAACLASIVALVVCAVVGLGGCEKARRARPAQWHAAINGVIFFAAAFLSEPSARE